MKKVMAILLSAITILGMSIPVFADDRDEEKYTVQIMGDPLLISTNKAKDTYSNVVIKGKNIDLAEHGVVINNGKVMVPLKATAESLGFKVNVDENNNTVFLENEGINTSITVGEDKYYYSYSNGSYIACGKAVSVGASPMIIDNVIYVSIKVYNVFFNDQKAVGSFFCKTKDGQTIYVDNGDLATGWKLINDKWYFMNNDGVMQKGWIQSNGNWYYLNDNGEMVSNTVTPDGYTIDKNGRWNLEIPVITKYISTISRYI